MTFASKRDVWLSVFLVITAIAILSALIVLLIRAQRTEAFPIYLAIAILLLVCGLVTWVFADTRYVIAESTLFIRSGPLRWQVPIGEIESVSPTHDPSSSPALSLDRLSIKYRKDGDRREILVSPRDKPAFLHALRGVNPRIAAQ
jgi:Bacterial PH domain